MDNSPGVECHQYGSDSKVDLDWYTQFYCSHQYRWYHCWNCEEKCSAVAHTRMDVQYYHALLHHHHLVGVWPICGRSCLCVGNGDE